MKSLYRPILTQSWQLCRSKFFLWPLAIFAALAGTVTASFKIVLDLLSISEAAPSFVGAMDSNLYLSLFVGWNQAFDRVNWSGVGLAEIPWVLALIVLLFIAVLIAILVTCSEGGLMYGCSELQQNKPSSFIESFRQGLYKFWPLFIVRVTYDVLYLMVLGLIIYPLLVIIPATTSLSRLSLLVIVYLVVVPVMVVFDIVLRYTLMYIMLFDARYSKSLLKTLADAFNDAWLLFRTNWLISIETSLIIFSLLICATIVVSGIIAPIILFAFYGFVMMAAASSIVAQLFILILIVLFISLLILFIVMATTFHTSMWVGVFRAIATDSHHSKIHRLVRHFPALHRKVI